MDQRLLPEHRLVTRGGQRQQRAAIGAFVAWVRENPRPDTRAWEVAVLTFYRGQEAALRERLQAAFSQHGNFHTFNDGACTHVSLCTVDRFQGHEADLVLLSFVKTRSVGFLNSPNRLNVALTRARYQIVLIGHRAYFASDRCRSPLLRALAGSEHYPHEITWSTR
ncbi:C-terminal helicase domain-containing protein [Nannocystis pusilla]|uniref:C-terminal helicase domain-containing protein n=1 Tax=Nannocystis pusilla TaxID=889268 RepID=UPI003DA2EF9B